LPPADAVDPPKRAAPHRRQKASVAAIAEPHWVQNPGSLIIDAPASML